MFKAKVQGFIAGILVAALFVGTLVFAAPQIREVFYGVNVVVNGELQNFDDDMQPFISEGRTFLPVRGIAEALGVDVNWDGETQTVYIGEVPEQTFENLENIEIGDIVEFGNYQWRVLDIQDGKALLLSEFLLGRIPYHYNEAVTWEISNVRRRLNSEFYHRFTIGERARISETYIVNNDNELFETPGGSNTTDKIFFLSLEEIFLYFGDSGAVRNDWISDQYDQARLALVEDANGNVGRWWTRTPGTNPATVLFVQTSGAITTINPGHGDVSIRPAMWVYL